MKTDLDSLSHFVQPWLEKAADVSDSTDSPFVDRFVFIYISFNALYTSAANVLDGAATSISTWSFSRGGPPKRRFKKYPTEQKRATALVVDVIGHRKSAESIATCKDAVEALCDSFGTGRILSGREDFTFMNSKTASQIPPKTTR